MDEIRVSLAAVYLGYGFPELSLMKALISGEISEYLRKKLANRKKIRRIVDTPRLAEDLSWKYCIVHDSSAEEGFNTARETR